MANLISTKESLSKTPFGKNKLSEMLPILEIAANMFNLKLNKPMHMRAVIRIVNNSVKNN